MSKFEIELERKCQEIFGESYHFHQIVKAMTDFNKPFQDYSHLSEDLQKVIQKLEGDFKYIFGILGPFLEFYRELVNSEGHMDDYLRGKMEIYRELVNSEGHMDDYLRGKMAHFDKMHIIKIVLNNKIEKVKDKQYQGAYLRFINVDIRDLNLFLYGDGVSDMEIYNQGAYYFYQNIKRPSDGMIGYCSNYIKYRFLESWWNHMY